ncbi:MAG: hypothetical protein M3R38_07515 [Actinomycetota bacterium]|nr:hypothetical protein [Actinomycetota bacterium]
MAEVRIIYLPPGEGGRKCGADDFLAAGNTVADLLAHATSELREPARAEDEDLVAEVPYRATTGGLVWDRPTQDGSAPVPLTNFNARIVADVAEDDGAEIKRSFKVEASLGERRVRFDVPAARFAPMAWPTDHLGASAIVYPGFSQKDHARAAIQLLSENIDERTIYTHTGWRLNEGVWVYLHGDGAIGPKGEVEGVEVRLDDALSLYRLPPPPNGDELRAAVRASLRTWGIGPDGLVIPQHAAAFRTAMGETDHSVHVAGPTGEGKSEVASVFLRHFGAGLDARNLLSWESTENALEAQAFALKNALVVIDDFAPNGTAYDIQRWHKKADRVLRAKGNAAGRSRMGADLTIRVAKPPRAMILSTGEDTPRGQSLRARMLVLEHGEADVAWERLTECQRDAEAGLYAAAMAGFVSWLAPRYGEVLRRMPEEVRELREQASRVDQHKRTPGIAADLGLGLRYFLSYAEETGAITAEEAAELRKRGWKAILEAAGTQRAHQAASEPAKRFVELISSAVASGRAHIAATSGEKPQGNAGALGWRKTGGEYADGRSQGDRIGWADGEDLYLEPEAAYRVAQREAQGGEALTVSARTTRKRLKEKGLLVSVDDKRQTLTVRRTIEGVKDRSVLHLRLSSLFSDGDEPDEPDAEGEEPDRNGGSGPSPSSGSAVAPQKPDERTDETSGSEGARRVSGRAPDAEELLGDEEGGDGRRVRRVAESGKALLQGDGVVDEPFSMENLGFHEMVTTPYGLDELISHLREVDTVAVDLETVGLNPATLRVRIVSVTTEKGTWLVDCSAIDPSPSCRPCTARRSSSTTPSSI